MHCHHLKGKKFHSFSTPLHPKNHTFIKRRSDWQSRAGRNLPDASGAKVLADRCHCLEVQPIFGCCQHCRSKPWPSALGRWPRQSLCHSLECTDTKRGNFMSTYCFQPAFPQGILPRCTAEVSQAYELCQQPRHWVQEPDAGAGHIPFNRLSPVAYTSQGWRVTSRDALPPTPTPGAQPC